MVWRLSVVPVRWCSWCWVPSPATSSG